MYIKSIATLKTLYRKEKKAFSQRTLNFFTILPMSLLTSLRDCSGSMRASLLFFCNSCKNYSGVAIEKKSRHIGQICMISILTFANVLSKLNIIHAYFSVTSVTAIHTLILFYKQRFISNDFLTSLFLKKIKQRTSLFSKN